jgi:hypothetical protein
MPSASVSKFEGVTILRLRPKRPGGTNSVRVPTYERARCRQRRPRNAPAADNLQVAGETLREADMKREIIRVEPLSTYLEKWKAPSGNVATVPPSSDMNSRRFTRSPRRRARAGYPAP